MATRWSSPKPAGEPAPYTGSSTDYSSLLTYLAGQSGDVPSYYDTGLDRRRLLEGVRIGGPGFIDWLNANFAGHEANPYVRAAVGATFGLAAGAGAGAFEGAAAEGSVGAAAAGPEFVSGAMSTTPAVLAGNYSLPTAAGGMSTTSAILSGNYTLPAAGLSAGAPFAPTFGDEFPVFGDNPEFFPESPFEDFGFSPTFGGFESPSFSQPVFSSSGAPSWADMPYFAAGETGGLPRGVWEEMMRKRGRFPLLDIASGIYGLSQSRGIERAARRSEAAIAGIDPMGPQRAQYAAQLAKLAADPSGLTNTPGYKAGLQAVERRLAAQGYLGSGNMMLALQNYGGEAYNREVARLAALASPPPGLYEATASAGRTAVEAKTRAAELRSRSLGSIGYGAYNWFS